MRIEGVAPFGVAGLHRNLPPPLDALLQKRRKSVLEFRFRQVIEQDLGH
jgi:hypothetical protein